MVAGCEGAGALRILHISDVHVQIDYNERPWRSIGWRRVAAQLELKLARRAKRYAEAPKTLARLAAEAIRQGVDHVVLSGDLTALALDEEFEGVRKALGALADDPTRLSVVPGNHDVFTPGSHRKQRFENWFGHLLDSDLPELRAEGPWPNVRFVGDSGAIVGLSSARVPAVPGIAAGRIGPDQLAALVRICEHPKVRGRQIFVVVHHAPLRRDGKADRRDHGLLDAAELLRVCTKGGVAAVLCGHLHLRYTYQVQGGPLVICGGSSTWLGHEGYWVIDAPRGQSLSAWEHSLVPDAVALPGAAAASALAVPAAGVAGSQAAQRRAGLIVAG